ncbi:MAG: DUF2339 domain-containing protein, partial [Gaiella sp.]
MGSDGLERIERLERQLEALRAEVSALRAVVAAMPFPPPSAAARPVVSAPEQERVVAPVRPSRAQTPVSLAGLWRQLERGEIAAALEGASDALTSAVRADDDAALAELAAFADVALHHADDLTRPGAERLLRAVRSHAGVAMPRAPTPAPQLPAPPATTGARAPRTRVEPVVQTPGLGTRAMAWLRAELTGARVFAIAGGVVTLLGVLFLFVLAANRGWIGPAERVALGAATSAVLLGVGLALRLRYGRVVASLAAVGAGIAAAFTTLAAATLIYDYLPPWGAVFVAAAIASVGAAIAIAWSSEILAGLALVGAVVAPAAVALDDGIEWAGTAFALVVLAA